MRDARSGDRRATAAEAFRPLICDRSTFRANCCEPQNDRPCCPTSKAEQLESSAARVGDDVVHVHAKSLSLDLWLVGDPRPSRVNMRAFTPVFGQDWPNTGNSTPQCSCQSAKTAVGRKRKCEGQTLTARTAGTFGQERRRPQSQLDEPKIGDRVSTPRGCCVIPLRPQLDALCPPAGKNLEKHRALLLGRNLDRDLHRNLEDPNLLGSQKILG